MADNKREEMRCLQWKLRRKGGKVKYQLITDATADLAEDMLRQVPNLKIIPMEVILNGTLRAGRRSRCGGILRRASCGRPCEHLADQ